MIDNTKIDLLIQPHDELMRRLERICEVRDITQKGWFVTNYSIEGPVQIHLNPTEDLRDFKYPITGGGNFAIQERGTLGEVEIRHLSSQSLSEVRINFYLPPQKVVVEPIRVTDLDIKAPRNGVLLLTDYNLITN